MTIVDLHHAYQISIFILLISTFCSSLELISLPKPYLVLLLPIENLEARHRNWLTLHSVQTFLTLITFIAFLYTDGVFFECAFVALTISTLVSYIIKVKGRNGCDQVRMLALLSYSFCFMLDKDMGQMTALFFIGTQILIAYATSGLVKVFSKHWRQGTVLANILNTYSYGVPKFSKFLNKNPGIQKAVTLASVLTMLSVPISFFLPFHTLLLCSLFCMFIFHVLTGLLMGLNDFFYTFPLAYPGILLMHTYMHGL